MNNLNELITELIRKYDQGNLKRVMAKVLTVYNQNKATVSLVGTDTEITLPNKTGEILKAGDYVHVHYWGNISSGYLAVKNGDVTPASGNIGDKTITENGIYYAVSDHLDGYGTVTVEVEPNLGTIRIRRNGTYRAESSGYEGFGEVEVDVPTVTPMIGQVDKAYGYPATRTYVKVNNNQYH